MGREKHYFPNLTPLRFIAAFLIIIHHVEQIKQIAELPNAFDTRLVYNIGKLSVIFFFTLSGYLITYLLLAEKKERGGIHIGKFYLRRLLRIWPLYYLIILIAFLVVPQFISLPEESSGPAFTKNLLLHLFFLPNLALAVYGTATLASHTWSIGTEEQFYLFWPWIVRTRWNKYLAFSCIIAAYLAIKFCLPLLPQTNYVYWFSGFWDLFNIDCMAIGGLFALLLFEQKTRVLRFIYHPATQIATYALVITLLFFPANYELFSFLFSIIIINLSANPKSLLNLQYKLLDYLGKISYGIYMYHILAIVAVMKVLEHFELLRNAFIYPLSFLLAIFISAVSYELFEKRFLKMKPKVAPQTMLHPEAEKSGKVVSL